LNFAPQVISTVTPHIYCTGIHSGSPAADTWTRIAANERAAVECGERQPAKLTFLSSQLTLLSSYTDISQFSTDISQFSTDISQFPTDISQFSTDISQFSTDISQVNERDVAAAEAHRVV
jgi:hypothetical protein